MILADLGGQFLIDGWCEGVGTLRFSRHKKEVAVTTLLVKIELHVGLPGVEQGKPAAAFWVLVGQPVAIEVKPVVVGSPIGNRLSVLAVIGVGAGHLSAMAVGPVGKAIKAIGIKHGVKNNHHVFKLRCNRRIQRRIEVVGDQGRGVTAAGLVTVNAVHHMHDRGLLGQISRIGRGNNLSSGSLNSLQLIDVGFGGYGVTHQ